jgi:lysophospholipid acyltransferase (LPLAT)-like uncharacterized protein
MGLVWRTSRVRVEGVEPARKVLEESGGFVCLLWHEDTALSYYAWAKLGIRPHVLVNQSFAGDISASIARRCGYTVVRGGASSGRRRRRPAALREMIEHMAGGEDVVYGIAVDGSRGPPYRLKRGALVVARECAVPVALVRVASAPCLRLPTWDRLAIPLPFGRIRVAVDAPHRVPADARSRPRLLRVAAELEARLLGLAAQSLRALERPLPPALQQRLAEVAGGGGAGPPSSPPA